MESQANKESITKEAKTWGMLCHLSALSGFLIPFGNILGPLICWLVKKDTDSFIDKGGKESLNFQISMMIYGIISGILTLILIGFLMLAAIAVLEIVYVIIASIKANEGQNYHYPLTIRFIK
ncbi:DUF4870 domain-containing protein [Bacillus taeanensis]|uniref:DUF4870 domain-containing protein n=1 Tax=Bacillus taeanensis TaxID=273032 RepID=A0A366XTA3_9BACI|nr:DUF4870 domain-containing protein [Bacillus taeanensis]RBW67384.1 DUF4870 domain-containing protein [Bacillus taeanensis]